VEGNDVGCRTGECNPASHSIKSDPLHPLIPRETKWWRDLNRGRAAVEHEFGPVEETNTA
jgi:hypothetical protein